MIVPNGLGRKGHLCRRGIEKSGIIQAQGLCQLLCGLEGDILPPAGAGHRGAAERCPRSKVFLQYVPLLQQGHKVHLGAGPALPLADPRLAQVIDKGLDVARRQLVQADMTQSGIGALLQLVEPGHAAGPQVGLRVLLEPLFAKGLKLDGAAPALAGALLLEQNRLALELLLDLPGGHARSGPPGHGAGYLLPVGVIATICPDTVGVPPFCDGGHSFTPFLFRPRVVQ